MITFNNPYLYVKGTCNVVITDPITGNVDYQSSKVQTNQITTDLTLDPIKAGLGNATAIQLATDCALNLTLTNADFSMSARAMQLGSSVEWNAPAAYCESITASGSTLTVSKTPVACPGQNGIYAYIQYSGNDSQGTAYTINPETKEIQGFTASNGTTYTVFY